MRVSVFAALFTLITAPAMAATLTDQKVVSTASQDTVFTFNNVAASDGTGGTLTLGFKGDYTYFNQSSGGGEYARLSFAGVGGSVDVYNGRITNNSMTGLTLQTMNADTAYSHDTTFSVVFAVSGALLDSILNGGSVTATLDNANGVNFRIDPSDYNAFTLDYTEAAAPVPLPAGLPLLGAGLAAFGIARRLRG